MFSKPKNYFSFKNFFFFFVISVFQNKSKKTGFETNNQYKMSHLPLENGKTLSVHGGLWENSI